MRAGNEVSLKMELSSTKLRQGTYCYVLPSCRASPAAMPAVGRIVEVVAGPYHRPRSGSAQPYVDVRYRDEIYYCLAGKLRAINDPDADFGPQRDDSLAS
jgi:hypothetical protein